MKAMLKNLWTTGDVEDLTGLPRPTVNLYVTQREFPAPFGIIGKAQLRVWLKADVLKWWESYKARKAK